MNRRPFSVRSLAAVAAAESAAVAMSHRPHFRGGRSQYGRGYCDRPAGERPEFVSGDSHFNAVRDANSGFRPYYNAVPPPPQYFTAPQVYGSRPRFQRPRAPFVQMEPQLGPRPFNRPTGGPAPRNYQQLRPQTLSQQSSSRATKPPDYREWEYRKMVLPPHCERFSVLSYNILGDYLASDHWQNLYYHIPRYIMNWNWRKKNIIFELGLWSADILCFQEVDRFQDIEGDLKPRGYSGIWKMRTGNPVDGCAIFWRASRFKLICEESIEYNKLGLRDNVAQICVFESLNGQRNRSGASTQSTSSARPNRVVVCNIHVLFNPKRGDIKLGQIRVLLERANAVSKRWDNAPIVLCGDFNCTPESPMYNFIKQQGLDLSEFARDKISGQVSAEIHRPRSTYPYFRAQDADNFTQASAVKSGKLGQVHLLADAQNFTCSHLSADVPFTGSCTQSDSSDSVKTSEPCFSKEHQSRVNDLPNHNEVDSCATKGGMSTSSVAPSISNQSVSCAQGDIRPPILPNGGKDGIFMLGSSSEEISVEETEGGECVESDSETLSETAHNQIEQQCLSDNEVSKTSTYYSGFSQLEKPSKDFGDTTLSKHVAVAISNPVSTSNNKISNVSAPRELTSSDIILDEKFEDLSLYDTGHKVTEDCESFISELHSSGQSPFSTERNSSSPIEKLHDQGEEILDQDDIFSTKKSPFNSSAWTPAEIEIATGTANCKVMEHPLKLTSAYTEVESSPGLRDPSGEPYVTSYHSRFSGTVDYIWHSPGVETVKVLAPIAKHVMHQTGGFPTKKWGSDHIALVSEFVFTKDISSQTPKE